MSYYLPHYYIQRDSLVEDFCDLVNNNESHQKEVYVETAQFAKTNNLKSIIDIGCGAAYKLLKYFGDIDTLGIDLPKTIKHLNKCHPHKKWMISDPSTFGKLRADIVLCSDVIEHIDRPDEFAKAMAKIKAKYFFFSTPNRDLLYPKDHKGPPRNPTHYREWNDLEFKFFLEDFFEVLEFSNTNIKQGTMLFKCVKKKPRVKKNTLII